MTTTPQQEQQARFLESLVSYAHAEGKQEAERAAARYLDVTPYSDGSSTATVVVLRRETGAALRNAIRDRRWHRNTPYDCSGLVFQSTCDLLKVGRTDCGWYAVAVVTTYLDI